MLKIRHLFYNIPKQCVLCYQGKHSSENITATFLPMDHYTAWRLGLCWRIADLHANSECTFKKRPPFLPPYRCPSEQDGGGDGSKEKMAV